MDREKLNRLLRLGIEKGASDIHFQAGNLPLYRFNGSLVELRFKVLTPARHRGDRAHAARRRSARAGHGLQRVRPRLRAAGRGPLPRQHLAPAPLLQHRAARSSRSRSRASRSSNLPAVLRDIAHLRRGYVLVTGATGMGKSTTLAAMIQEVNRDAEVQDHHDRRPDRVRLHARQEHHHAARDRDGHRTRSRRRCAPRCARIPT